MSLRKLFSEQFGVITRSGLRLIPPKNGPVAITLHNFSSHDWLWLNNVFDLIDSKFGFLNPTELRDGISSELGNRVLLTFDDGFLSNRILAQDVLAPRNIKALFFVTEGFIGLDKKLAEEFSKKCFYPKSSRLQMSDNSSEAMDWVDVLYLIEEGHEVAAHTQNHVHLSSIPENEKRYEIIESANLLENKLGKPVRYFAYPFGSFNAVDEISVSIARERFDLTFSNIRGNLLESPCPHFLYRQNIVPGMPIWLVKAIIEGRLDWRYSGIRRESYNKFK